MRRSTCSNLSSATSAPSSAKSTSSTIFPPSCWRPGCKAPSKLGTMPSPNWKTSCWRHARITSASSAWMMHCSETTSMQPDIEARVEGRMQDFVATLLRHEGALVEPIEPEGLEVLAPPEVQNALGIGEMSRLGFGTTLPPAAQRVGMEGDWLERFARLLGRQGRWARQVLPVTGRSPGDPE